LLLTPTGFLELVRLCHECFFVDFDVFDKDLADFLLLAVANFFEDVAFLVNLDPCFAFARIEDAVRAFLEVSFEDFLPSLDDFSAVPLFGSWIFF